MRGADLGSLWPAIRCGRRLLLYTAARNLDEQRPDGSDRTAGSEESLPFMSANTAEHAHTARRRITARGRPGPGRSRRARPLLAALACAAVLAGAAPVVSAGSAPLGLTMFSKTDTAVEGGVAPAKLTLALSRRLQAGERVDVPLAFGSATADVGLELEGSRGGVALDGRRVRFTSGARRAVVLVSIAGDVAYDSFTASVPQAVASARRERGRDDRIWVSPALARRGVAVDTASRVFAVGHLPTASIAVPEDGSTVTEGGEARFEVRLDRPWAGPGKRLRLAVEIAGDASGGRRTVVLSRGQAARTVVVPTADDDAAGPGGAVTATLLAAPRHWLGAATSASVAVIDDDGLAEGAAPRPRSDDEAQPLSFSLTEPQPGVVISPPTSDDEWVSPSEGRTSGTPFNYCAALSVAPEAAVTVTPVATPNIAAAAPVVFEPDGWGRKCFEVHASAAAQNNIDEAPREVTLTHAAVSADRRYGGINIGRFSLYVHDDDPTTVLLGASDTSATEGDASAAAALTVTVGRPLRTSVPIPSGLDGEVVTVDELIDVPLVFAGGVLGEDFRLELDGKPAGVTLTGNRVRFSGTADGSATSATIKLVALDDADGLDATLKVTIPTLASSRRSAATSDSLALVSPSISGNGGVSLSGTATIAIDDDDPAPPPPPPPVTVQFSTSWGGIRSEDAGTHSVTVEASRAPGSDLTVQYKLSDRASAGSDYTIAGLTGSSASLTIPAGQTSVTIAVRIVDDAVGEWPVEHVRMTLAAGDGYVVGFKNSHSFAIRDDDEVTSTAVKLMFPMGYVVEGGKAYVTAGLTLPLSHAVTIPLVVASGTSESGDHGTVASITIPANDTAGIAEVRTFADSDGDDETFTVSLGTPLPAKVTAGDVASVTVTIRDPD